MPPDAVRITDPPWQKVVGPFGVITGVGNGFTVTGTLALLLQPLALVTVTVYVPLADTVIAAVAAALDHR